MVTDFNEETIKVRAPRSVPSTPTSSSSAHPSPPPFLRKPKENENKTTLDSDWVISIRDKLDKACQYDVDNASIGAHPCIVKVPLNMREGDNSLYMPQIVSIGPYHHERSEQLKGMDRHKWRSLQQVLKRTKHDVKKYLIALKRVEDRIRACYEGPVGYGSDEFVEMVLLDGCFILELFQGYKQRGFLSLGYPRNDPIFTIHTIMFRIQRDLFMLENQLPLFVLDLLLGIQLAGEPEEQKGWVLELAHDFLLSFSTLYAPLTHECATTFDPMSDQGNIHFLEVIHRIFLGSEPLPEPTFLLRRSYSERELDKGQKEKLQLIHCVTKLREAGIKFKPNDETNRFLDIKFQDGILKIPRIFINEVTELLFFNLIAFEQRRTDYRSDITSYVIFIHNLISSPEDILYLRHCGISNRGLGSDDDIVDLFSRLSHGVVLPMYECYLHPLSMEVEKYCKHKRHSWLPSLKNKYFSNPWTIISLLAAVILLSATLAQTFYTVYAYYRPPKS